MIHEAVVHRTLFDRSRDGIVVVDDGGNVFDSNAAFAGMLGYTREELARLKIWDWDARWSREELLERIATLKGQAATFETVHRRKDGTCLEVEVSVSGVEVEGHVYLLGLHRDISERKKTALALAESEERFSAIFHSSSSAIVLTDLVSGAIVDANARYLRLVGLTRAQVVGHSAVDLGLWHSIADRQRALEVVAEHGHVQNFEALLIVQGKLVPVLLSASRLEMRGRDYVLWELRDISDRKLAEEQRAKLEAQLFQAQKMEAIGQLAGGVAHDLNNLLHVIAGHTEMAQLDLPADHSSGDSLASVAGAAQRAGRLVGQLLTFSRRQVIRPEALDLNEVVSSLLKLLRRVIGECIEIRFVPGARLATVVADPGMMEQVLMNLCVNARDAMDGEGLLTIDTANVALDDAYCAANPWADPGHFVRLRVTDDGHGMSAETLSHVFEPFFTTKEVGKGTGLGLATVYGIVHQHGGLIRVESEPDHGSTFEVYLPEAAPPARAATPPVAAHPAGGDETLLVAEDDAAVRALTSSILTRAGYRVVTASDGEDALRVFDEHRDTVRMLIMDVVMPRLGGREAAERMQATAPDVPALFTTGYSEDSIHSRFVLLPGTRLLLKPYAAGDLLREVRTLLDERAARGQAT